MFKRTISAALIFGAAALAPPVMAQSVNPCMARDSLVEALARQYQENMTGRGLQNPGQLLEIWSSDETGSFTVFITRPDGLACIVASGQHWHSAVIKEPGGVAG